MSTQPEQTLDRTASTYALRFKDVDCAYCGAAVLVLHDDPEDEVACNDCI